MSVLSPTKLSSRPAQFYLGIHGYKKRGNTVKIAPVVHPEYQQITDIHGYDDAGIEMSFSTMKASSNGNIFRVTGLLCGNSPVTFPAQRPVTRSFDVFFDLRLNQQLSK